MHINTDNPNIPRTLIDDAELFVALTAAWEEASKEAKTVTCKQLQDEMERVLCGRPMMIRIDSTLGLSTDF